MGAKVHGGGADQRLRGALVAALALLVALTAVESRGPTFHGAPPIHVSELPAPVLPAIAPQTAATLTGPRASGDGCGLTFSPGAALAAVGRCSVVEIGDSLGNDLG